jgi:PAS domain S-box-containing protein
MSELRVQQLMDLAHDGVMELDVDGRITALNDRSAAMLGIPDRLTGLGQSWSSLWPSENRLAAADAVAYARGGRATRFVATTVDPDEVRHWWSVSVGPLTDVNASITALGAVARDITERVRMEASLDAINEAMSERLAVAKRSLASGGRREVSLADDLARAERAVSVSDRANAVLRDRLDLASMAQGVAERAAEHAQKNEAIGQLVAGMAHDLNNDLQAVMSALDAVLSGDDVTAKQEKFLGYALTAARQGSVMSRRLLGFSRKHPYQPERLDLGEVMAEVLPMVEGTLGPQMRVEVSSSPDPLPVFADGHLVQQGLLNLCVNARDACEGGGVIRLSFGTEHVAADPVNALPEGEYVFADVADDGPGMSDEVREKLFQPFFTTKPAGKGTGLGMAQVMGAMRHAGGTVVVTTALGEGTRVRLLFPRAKDAAEA